MAGEPWTEEDVAVLAREYFAVLHAEATGESVNKNEALRRAQAALLVDRTVHTLKDRCYRISEELWKRDLPWVEGWKPPPLVGQSPNSANVAATIWSAIEPMASRLSSPTEVDDSNEPLGESQSFVTDTERRRAIEEVAQDRLMDHFRDLGWNVEDTHLTSPFDARAIRGTEVLFLEAKGTISDGLAVFVTSGEVEWARAHPGQCVMGIVSNVVADSAGNIDPASGDLRIVDWVPGEGDLRAIQFQWVPPQ